MSQALSAKRWVMGIQNWRASQGLSEYDAAGERLDLQEQARRGLNSRTINTRICHVVANVWSGNMGVEMPELRFATSLAEDSADSPRFLREGIRQVLGHAIEFRWLLS